MTLTDKTVLPWLLACIYGNRMVIADIHKHQRHGKRRFRGMSFSKKCNKMLRKPNNRGDKEAK